MLRSVLRMLMVKKKAVPAPERGHVPISQQEYREAFRRVDEAHVMGRPNEIQIRDALVIKGYSRPTKGYDSFGWPEGDPRSPNAITG